MSQGKNIRSKALKTIIHSILLSTVLALGKFVAGWWGNSFALIADAIESASDVLSSFIVFLGLKVANLPSDKNHPFGHGKVEPLVTFVVVAVLCTSSVVIAGKAIQNIQTPDQPPLPFTLIVLAVIILLKEASYRYVISKGEEMDSSSLKADAWHHRSDALTSLAAFVGICVALVGGEGYESADDWAALFASAVILYNAYKIFRPALGELLDEQKYDELISHIKQLSLQVEGVENTEKCYIRKFGMYYYVDIHVRVYRLLTVEQGHDIAHALKAFLQKHYPQIQDVFTHIEPTLEDSTLEQRG